MKWRLHISWTRIVRWLIETSTLVLTVSTLLWCGGLIYKLAALLLP